MPVSLGFAGESQYGGVVAGIDEVGRGPWAGPVVAAAVILDRHKPIIGINDSKALSRHQRESLFLAIHEVAHVGIGVCSVEEIDTHNILGATKIAMCKAYDALAFKPDISLVDGNQLPALPCIVKGVVGGDATCISIAAASIVAKVTRDRMMAQLAEAFPGYGWEDNAGYGTKRHQEGLKRYGVTVHHRRSFAPIRVMLAEMGDKGRREEYVTS